MGILPIRSYPSIVLPEQQALEQTIAGQVNGSALSARAVERKWQSRYIAAILWQIEKGRSQSPPHLLADPDSFVTPRRFRVLLTQSSGTWTETGEHRGRRCESRDLGLRKSDGSYSA